LNLCMVLEGGEVQKWGFAAPASFLVQLLIARQARRDHERGDG